jgi:hypothetical protein
MMTNHGTDGGGDRPRELLMRVARAPRFCGSCVCLSDEDRGRARRVFRLTRAVIRSWPAEARA